MIDLELWQTVLQEMHIAYALLDGEQRIIAHDALFAAWLAAEQTSLLGQHVFDVLPEFYGQDIRAACAESVSPPAVRLENVNRLSSSGEIRYFDMILLPCSRGLDAAFLVLIADVTE